MNTSPEGEAFIKDYEQLCLSCYKDDVGLWTVGWGHRVDSDLGAISESDADAYFDYDLRRFETTVDGFGLMLSQCQFDALVSFAYNAGSVALRNSTLLKKLRAGDIPAAADEFLRWNKGHDANGNVLVLAGLTKRRKAEREMFLHGVYDSSH